jgi:molybdopterin-binding protein
MSVKYFHPTVKGIFDQETAMKLSARNVLKGKITKVTRGATTSHVLIDVNGAIITSSITNEAVDELKLKEGMDAAAVIKSSDVLVAVE